MKKLAFYHSWPRYTFSVLWMILIVLACLIDLRPIADDLPKVFGLDKVVHFFLYFVLTFLFLWEHNHRQWRSKAKASMKLFWLTVLVCGIYGGLIEFLQSLTSYRGMDQMDWVADIVGGLFAYLLYYVFNFKAHDDSEK